MQYSSARCRFPGAAVRVLLLAVLVGCSQQAPSPKGDLAAKADGPQATSAADPAAAQSPAKDSVKIGACDGGDPVEVSKDMTGKILADTLLDQWRRSHPNTKWVAEQQEKHDIKPPADNTGLLEGGQAQGNTYGKLSPQDLLVWQRETEKFVAEGSRIFHDSKALGSTVAVSCDMCHPNASNTHPETYPKFQTQLGRVALLRDMINWCIQNPVRGEQLDPDGPTMRALEAYIISQRKGTVMDYGKH